MKISKKALRIITFFLLIIIIGGGVYLRIKPQPGGDKTGEGTPASTVKTSGGRTDVSISVQAEPAFTGDLIMSITAQGIVEALREIILYPKISGIIKSCNVYEGKYVKKGDVLYQLEDDELKLELKNANSELLKAQVDYIIRKGETQISASGNPGGNNTQVENFIEKWKAEKETAEERLNKGEITREEYENILSNYNIALGLSGERRDRIVAFQSGLTRAEVAAEKARINLDRATERAPFSGKVADLDIDVGHKVTTATECLRLLNISKVKVRAGVLESETGYLEVGRKAYCTFSAYPGEVFEGVVSTINPAIDPKTKTCQVTITIDNPEEKIKPGMYASVKIEAQIFKNRFLVNKDAILLRDQRKLLFIIRDGLAKWSYVETGRENEYYTEIISSTLGLKEGELVAVSGHYTLAHDTRVRIEKE